MSTPTKDLSVTLIRGEIIAKEIKRKATPMPGYLTILNKFRQAKSRHSLTGGDQGSNEKEKIIVERKKKWLDGIVNKSVY